MQFGGVVAINNLSLEVNKGEIISLIGPNGAGKTTAFNVVTGVYAPTNGAVYFNGKEIVENYPSGKINRNFFDFQYIIGKGGFGKVTNKSHIIL